jgi:hypothetical protein
LIGLPESFLKQYNEKHSPHTLFGVISSSVSQGASWATALLNWAKRKEITINGAAKTPLFTELFTSSSAWSSTTTNITFDTTTDMEVDWNIPSTMLAEQISHDLTSISSSWVLRGELDVSALTSNTDGTGKNIIFAMSDSDYTADTRTGVHDMVGIRLHSGSSSTKFYGGSLDGVAGIWNVNQNLLNTITSTNKYYLEIVMINSTSARFTVYADSEYTEVLATGTQTGLALVGLRYIYFGINEYDGTTNGTLTGHLDNIKFYNGETTVENIPSQQTATYSDNLSASTDFTVAGGTVLTYGTNEINFDLDAYANAEEIYWDLDTLTGLTVSDMDYWTVRMRMDMDTFTQGSSGAQYQLGVGISSSTNNFRANQDFMGFFFTLHSGGAKVYATAVDGVNIHDGTETAFTSLPATGDVIYWELVKNGDTITVNWYSDSAFSVLVETQSSTDAGITGLKYLKITNDTLGLIDHEAIGSIDDIEFYANIPEVNPSTLTDYPLPIKIIGDADLQEKTTETLDSDFTSATGWSIIGSDITLNTTDERIELVYSSTATDQGIAYDATAIGSTFRLDWDTNPIAFGTTTNYLQYAVGVSDSDENFTFGDESQDGFCLVVTAISGTHNRYRLYALDAGNIVTGSASFATATRKMEAGVAEYNSMVSDGNNVYLRWYADKARTILLEEISTPFGSVTGLQYVKMDIHDQGATHQFELNIPKMRLWNGITNPVNQEVATFSDDFTGTDDWVDGTAGVGVNVGTDEFDFVFNGADDNSVFDLGVGGVDEKFIIRFDNVVFDTLTPSTNTLCGFGLSSNSETTTANDDENAVWILPTHANSLKSWRYAVWNTKAVGVDVATGTIDTTDVATATGYYLEIIRHSQFVYEFNVYSDVYITKLYESGKITAVDNASSLRYIKVQSSTNGTMSGDFQKVEFWNGVTSPNAEGRKIVFTDNAFDGDAVEYASETTSYDPINGDWTGYVKIPSLATGADTTIQMYYDYTPSATPSYVPEIIASPTPTADEDFTNHTVDTTVDNTEVFGWTPNDASQAWIDEGTNALEFNQTNENSNNALAFDLHDARGFGSATNISDSKWRLDFDTTLDSFSGGQNQSRHWFGLSSHSETTGLQTAQDAIWLHFSPYNSGWGVDTSDNAVAPQATGTSLTFATGTVYSWSLIRDGNTVIAHRWTDSTRTSIAQTSTQDISAKIITDLRYIKFSNRNQTSIGGVRGRIENVKLWNEIFVTTDREKATWNSNYKAVHHLQGNSTDSTAYGNDGTDTAISYEQQNNSVGIGSDGTTTNIAMGSDSSLDGIWSGGGILSLWVNIGSDGEGDNGRIISKEAWSLYTTGESAGFLKLNFLHGASTRQGVWNVGGVSTPIDTLIHVVIKFNSDSIDNLPVFIIDGVRSPITQDTDPAGTFTSDAASNMTVLNLGDGTRTGDAFVDEIKLSDTSRPSSEAITSYNAEKSDSDIITAGNENTQ